MNGPALKPRTLPSFREPVVRSFPVPLKTIIGDLIAFRHDYQHAIVGIMVHSPGKTEAPGTGRAWRKLVSQQLQKKAKDKFAGTAVSVIISVDSARPLFQKTFQHKDRVPQRPRCITMP